MAVVDWIIVAVVLAIVTIPVLSTRKYTASVADFLAANRCAGRYILCVAGGAAGFGAISFVAMCEMYYSGGFSAYWWGLILLPAMVVTNLTGWIVYRYRQTRAMTLAQFFEIRYNQKFRIFSGVVCFVSGILNFGIFPAVSARFLIYFCGLPDTISVAGLHISVFVVLMLILNGISFFYTFIGGQIAIITAEFLQGVLCSIVFVVISLMLIYMFSWSQIAEGLAAAPRGQSMVHPFQTGQVGDFNAWYFVIGAFAYFYNSMGWQGSQAFNCSAKSAHEQKMAVILGNWRNITIMLGMLLMAVGAYVVMHHPIYAATAQQVSAQIGVLGNSVLRDQMTTPAVLSQILPHGITGLLCAVILVAILSTHASYMHSWGSIFIQDVVLVFTKRSLDAKSHLRLLRLSILGVAVFSFIFSLLFKQNQQIYMFFAITGAVFLGGSGAVIIGGLYWNRGTTAAAFSATIVGSSLAVLGIVLDQMWSSVVQILGWAGRTWPALQQIDFVSSPWTKFPINGQWMYLIAMLSAIVVYGVVSLFGKTYFNMDKLLHRGQYAVRDDAVQTYQVSMLSRLLGMGKEYSFADRCIYVTVLAWCVGWWTVFLFVTYQNLTHDISEAWWVTFWYIFVLINITVSTGTTIWLSVGGIRDLIAMFKNLKQVSRNNSDDGAVGSNADKTAAQTAEERK